MERFLDDQGNFVSMKQAKEYQAAKDLANKQAEEKVKPTKKSKTQVRQDYLSTLQEGLFLGNDEKILAAVKELKLSKSERAQFPMLAEKLDAPEVEVEEVQKEEDFFEEEVVE